MSGRLLVLCYFFPPLAGGGVHRVLGFTRHLPEHGWECTVVCAGEEDYWVVDESLLASVEPRTTVSRVRGGSALSAWLKLSRSRHGRRPGRLFSLLRALSDWWLVPDPYAGWARRAQRRGAALIQRGRETAAPFDAVLSSSPPDSVHLAARALARRSGLPWVADFRDPWIGLHLRAPRTAWHRAQQARLEREVLASADLVLAASATHARALEARSRKGEPAISRIVHLPNGYEPDDPAGRAISGPARSSEERATFELVYTGSLSLMPDVEVFLEALHEVLARRPEARRRLRARLAGPYESDYADRAEALGLTGIVTFLGPKSHAESRVLLRDADLLLLWKPRGCPTMVPGKVYEYLDTGRPLLAVLDAEDEVAEMVRAGGGAIVSPGDRAALAAEIERRYDAARSGASATTARPSWLDRHTRGRLAADLARLLDETVEAKR